MGVEGSALAITLAEVISSTGMLLILFRRRYFNIKDFIVIPDWREGFKMVREGIVLSTRSMSIISK